MYGMEGKTSMIIILCKTYMSGKLWLSGRKSAQPGAVCNRQDIWGCARDRHAEPFDGFKEKASGM